MLRVPPRTFFYGCDLAKINEFVEDQLSPVIKANYARLCIAEAVLAGPIRICKSTRNGVFALSYLEVAAGLNGLVVL